ncbi:MAG: hypothetical protein K5705_15330, partial [Oscillospiraceae bacterium]|nr:hypothetical protein [Oscillospiraceae bacterium]
ASVFSSLRSYQSFLSFDGFVHRYSVSLSYRFKMINGWKDDEDAVSASRMFIDRFLKEQANAERIGRA